MDEVFGPDNFVCMIAFSKTTGFSGKTLSSVADFILWYARDQERLKFQQIYRLKEAGEAGATKYKRLGDFEAIDSGRADSDKLATLDQLTSQGASDSEQSFEFAGRVWKPPAGMHWKTTVEGLATCMEMRRGGKPQEPRLTERPVAVVKWLDGTVLDTVWQVVT